MNIVIEYPPNYEQIKSAFDVEGKSVIYTYGDTIYNPLNGNVPDHLEVHEETHSVQQGGKPDKWWENYINDEKFRLSQEIEAYRNQYNFYCRNNPDRNKRFDFLYIIAKDLSSEIYGNIISRGAAIRAIKKNGKK